MNHLDKLESKSIHIIRESYNQFKNLCMLWSIGKDSTVLFAGRVTDIFCQKANGVREKYRQSKSGKRCQQC